LIGLPDDAEEVGIVADPLKCLIVAEHALQGSASRNVIACFQVGSLTTSFLRA